jgi:hypothetical protein
MSWLWGLSWLSLALWLYLLLDRQEKGPRPGRLAGDAQTPDRPIPPGPAPRVAISA